MNELQRKIVLELLRKGVSLNPMVHCPEGYYTDHDDWDYVEIDGAEYDINLYCDGETFFFTAYPVKYDDDGDMRQDYSEFFHVLEMPIVEVAHD